ncbi:transcription regulation repressor, LACI family [Corynebacterium renale]|uniref:LacI family transcriptional regulator n=1 Tax=Corynebacterium renale TaxID=1724 RepID=A0A2A9DN51_9CORY|nr:LacI family DNA-binding transcriptional regulator [Corynebacterium renale]PFG28044.1 LacI family transcriptional regulator [Corynebacterium renale]SQG65369.1 transcription regulation repressor, LACI family [Corynebacterium renale]SQI21157.1 transcription regulation repressor, LACI family [Corynebacterium renale]STC99008.1 transcription regulation repressor, LACI family [Corynebacterium renale]
MAPTTPSLRDVAEAAGVGYGTASRALTGKGYVSPETKQKVLDAAHKLNYRPNYLAKALREDRTNLVGVILPDLINEFYSDATQVIQDRLAEAGYQMLVIAAPDAHAQDRAVQTLLDHRVAGIITVPVSGVEPVSQVPAVQLNRAQVPGIPAVISNDHAGFAALGKRFFRPGMRVTAIVGDPGLSTTRNRVQGLRESAADTGAELTVLSGTYSSESGYNLTAQACAEGVPDLLIVCSPRLMAGAVVQLREQGLNWPDDIRVVGYDDPEWYSMVGMSAVLPPHKEMGRAAVDTLLALFDGRDTPELQELMPHYVDRGSLDQL